MVQYATIIIPPAFVIFVIVVVIGLFFGILDKVVIQRRHHKIEQQLKHAEEVCSQVVELLQGTNKDSRKESKEDNEKHTKH